MHKAQGADQSVLDVSVERVVRPGPAPARQVKLALKLQEFDLPPVGDGVLIGRHAAIGPRGLFEAIDRMLPGMYELVAVDGHPKVEAVILRKSKLQLLARDRLVAVFLQQAEGLLNDTAIIRVDFEFQVAVQLELDS